MTREFVSRAGRKLQQALDAFKIDVAGLVCADLGSSTGGFVDCLLQTGAAEVYAVDTSYGELAWKLRQDPRVVVMERTNALYVELPELVDFISIDVGWTRQKLILPQAKSLLKSGGAIVTLIKPHYEAAKDWLQRGGLDPAHLDEVVEEVRSDIATAGFAIQGIVESPVPGKRRENKEYLAWLKLAETEKRAPTK